MIKADFRLERNSDVNDEKKRIMEELLAFARQNANFKRSIINTFDQNGNSSQEQLHMLNLPLPSMESQNLLWSSLSKMLWIQKLFLVKCALTILPTHIFQELKSLQHLNVAYNSLTSLPADLFLHSSVTYIECSYNNISSLPCISLSSLEKTRLRHLFLSNNAILYEYELIRNLRFKNCLVIVDQSLIDDHAHQNLIDRHTSLPLHFIFKNFSTSPHQESEKESVLSVTEASQEFDKLWVKFHLEQNTSMDEITLATSAKKSMLAVFKQIWHHDLDQTAEQNRVIFQKLLSQALINIKEEKDLDSFISKFSVLCEGLQNCFVGQKEALLLINSSREASQIHYNDFYQSFHKAFQKKRLSVFHDVVLNNTINGNNKQNTHILDYYRSKLDKILHLNYFGYTTPRVIGEDYFGENSALVLEAFLNAFPPQSAIEWFQDWVNQDFSLTLLNQCVNYLIERKKIGRIYQENTLEEGRKSNQDIQYTGWENYFESLKEQDGYCIPYTLTYEGSKLILIDEFKIIE